MRYMCQIFKPYKMITKILTIILVCITTISIIGYITTLVLLSRHLNDGCIKHDCTYTSDMGIGCMINVPGTKYGCELVFRSCETHNATCYTYEGQTDLCPLDSCNNPIYFFSIFGVGLIGGLILLVLITGIIMNMCKLYEIKNYEQIN